jgi:cell division cycle 14
MPFNDASMGPSMFKLTPKHCLAGFEKAIYFKWFDWDTFNIEEYEYFECVENGDLTVILPGKFIAFSGPHSTKVSPEGYSLMMPGESHFVN